MPWAFANKEVFGCTIQRWYLIEIRDTNVNGLALDVDFDIEHQVLDIDVIINDDDNDDDKDQFNEQ